LKPASRTASNWSTRRLHLASPEFRSARSAWPSRFHDHPHEDKPEVDELDLSSDVSDIEANLANTRPAAKLTRKTTAVAELSLDSHDSLAIETTKLNIKPRARALPHKDRREDEYQHFGIVNSRGEEIGLEEPCSDLESSASWEMALSGDEKEDSVVAVDDSEDWEVIDTEIYDHTTNSFKQIPSAIFADESVQQTLMNYIEKYKPTESQIEQVKNALGVLKFAAEFGYNAIKEPVVEWAEEVVKDRLHCGLDEVPRMFLATALDRMPQRTRELLVKVPGSVCDFQPKTNSLESNFFIGTFDVMASLKHQRIKYLTIHYQKRAKMICLRTWHSGEARCKRSGVFCFQLFRNPQKISRSPE
jgi:hypothetical protein